MKKALIIIAALIAAVSIWWHFNYPSVSINYRLTLEAEVDDKPVSGSGVLNVLYKREPPLNPYGGAAGARGEAVALDLGSRGTAFLLLKEDRVWGFNPVWIVPNAFKFGGLGSVDDYARLKALRGTADIPLASLPLLVRFRDINDPKTVERVDPDDLAASFGPGVKLVRATIEITDDPVTTGIVGRLQWLAGGYPEQRLVAATGKPVSEVAQEHLLTFSNFQRISK